MKVQQKVIAIMLLLTATFACNEQQLSVTPDDNVEYIIHRADQSLDPDVYAVSNSFATAITTYTYRLPGGRIEDTEAQTRDLMSFVEQYVTAETGINFESNVGSNSSIKVESTSGVSEVAGDLQLGEYGQSLVDDVYKVIGDGATRIENNGDSEAILTIINNKLSSTYRIALASNKLPDGEKQTILSLLYSTQVLLDPVGQYMDRISSAGTTTPQGKSIWKKIKSLAVSAIRFSVSLAKSVTASGVKGCIAGSAGGWSGCVKSATAAIAKNMNTSISKSITAAKCGWGKKWTTSELINGAPPCTK